MFQSTETLASTGRYGKFTGLFESTAFVWVGQSDVMSESLVSLHACYVSTILCYLGVHETDSVIKKFSLTKVHFTILLPVV